jgi:uncharacterized membrane protein YgcG
MRKGGLSQMSQKTWKVTEKGRWNWVGKRGVLEKYAIRDADFLKKPTDRHSRRLVRSAAEKQSNPPTPLVLSIRPLSHTREELFRRSGRPTHLSQKLVLWPKIVKTRVEGGQPLQLGRCSFDYHRVCVLSVVWADTGERGRSGWRGVKFVFVFGFGGESGDDGGGGGGGGVGGVG